MPIKRARIHEYLSFRAAVKTDAGTAAAAHTDESKVRVARDSGSISAVICNTRKKRFGIKREPRPQFA
jgi:hypothetical protein